MPHADRIMHASQRLYESLGFRRDERRDLRPDSDPCLVAWVLEL